MLYKWLCFNKTLKHFYNIFAKFNVYFTCSHGLTLKITDRLFRYASPIFDISLILTNLCILAHHFHRHHSHHTLLHFYLRLKPTFSQVLPNGLLSYIN